MHSTPQHAEPITTTDTVSEHAAATLASASTQRNTKNSPASETNIPHSRSDSSSQLALIPSPTPESQDDKFQIPAHAHTGRGARAYEGGILAELSRQFPDEESAELWFEQVVCWTDGRRCGYCGGSNTHETPKRKPMPYRCRACRRYFSVRTGTMMANSRLPLRKWAFALHIVFASPVRVTSAQLQRDIDVTQKTAWFMLNRIRKASSHLPPLNHRQHPMTPH